MRGPLDFAKQIYEGKIHWNDVPDHLYYEVKKYWHMLVEKNGPAKDIHPMQRVVNYLKQKGKI